MSSRKRVAIQLTREQISRILEALTRDDDLALKLSLREARARFGDRREAGKGPGWLIPGEVEPP